MNSKTYFIGVAVAVIVSSAVLADTTFCIETKRNSLVFVLSEKGLWRLPYVGAKLASPADVVALEGRPMRWHGDTVHPSYGVYGAPLANMDVDKFGGLAVRHADGSLVSDLVASERTPREIPDEAGVRHLVLAMKDRILPFFVDQHFRTDEDSDVVETWVEIRHLESAPVELLRMDSFAWSLPRVARNYTLLSLSSWWGAEGQLVSSPLEKSQALTINSRNGVRGAWDANPAFMLSLDETTEDHGRVFAGVLAWSGAWRMNFRRDWGDVVEMRAGVDNGNGAYRLEPGRTLVTPVFVFTYSENGRGQISRNFHRWARTRWLPHRTQPREVLLNSWEGSYLAFDEKTLTDMMDGVAELGGEMFVVDDGWFGTGALARDHNAGDGSKEGVCDSALGDWTVNRRKLPRGLEYLTSEAARRGLKFGIWVEPEMVSVGKSDLHARLPECPLQVKGRPILTGRGGTQAVLDFANPKVVDDLYSQLNALYSTPGVTYIKWDANANIFNPGSAYLPTDAQGNVWFDYTRGVYDLLSRLQKAHPAIVTQACSSGGGHMDYGTLRYCDEFWVSDDTDARERVFMQWGASQFYPASAQACHVTACPNHQTGRSTPLKFRFDVAMAGRLGFELHPKNMTSDDVAFAKGCVADYKRLRDVIQGGDLYRLVSPYGSSYASLMYAATDGSHAVVFVWGLNRGPNREFPAMIRLRGLSAENLYRISEINLPKDAKRHVYVDGCTISGSSLMNFGVEPVLSSGDYDSCVIVLDRI